MDADFWEEERVSDPNRACKYCRCTETKACVIDGDPCYWVHDHVCSNPRCVAKAHRETRYKERLLDAALTIGIILFLPLLSLADRADRMRHEDDR